MGIFSICLCRSKSKQLHYSKKTLRLILTAILAVDFVFLPVVPSVALACHNCPPPPPPVCEPNPEADLVGSITDSTGLASLTNSSTLCSYEVGLAVYKMFDENIDNQELFDSDLGTVGPESSLDLEVTLPDCAYQIDLFYGELIESFEGGLRYGERKLDWQTSLEGGYCSLPTYAISGMKFNDKNGNGQKDCVCEPGLQGWTITIDGPSCFSDSTVTDQEGHFIFSDLLPGSYTLCELPQEGWQQTYPTENEGCHLIEIVDEDISDLNFGNQQIVSQEVTIVAYKIVCQTEEDLPNWGAGDGGAPPMIDENTAGQFLASHPNCHLEADWDFQWGFQDKQCTQGVDKLSGDHIGLADGTPSSCELNCGSNTNTGTNYNDWKSFDSSTGDGTPATVTIDNLEEGPGIWVRENLKQGYIPFTYPPKGPIEDDFSAEMYCHNDIYRYDNYDLINSPELGETYYCLAFNAPQPPPICLISGMKFNDLNKNGLKECTEPGLENWTIQLKQAIACQEGDQWADEVVEYNPGRKDDYSELDPERANPSNALGPAQDDDTLNFVSLGFNGELILKFDNLIINGEGNDIGVIETTYGSPSCQDYSEKVHLYASQTGQEGSWEDLGVACLDSQFDLGSLAWAQYIKLVDETNPEDFGGIADGYDVDGVKALHCSGWEIIDTQITDENGHYCFSSIEPGDYRVEEILKAGWNNSTPLFQDATVVEGEPIIVNFGNYQLAGPYCGNGILETCEECDEGESNGVACTPEYGSNCTYCSLECDIIQLTGPYCGDGNLDEVYEGCDDGNIEDGDGCSAICQLEGPPPEINPGDIVINEIMQNPAVVDDSDGEWFELYNATTSALDLNGCVIRDNDADNHAIATSSLIISAGGYLVLAKNGDPSLNGGLIPDYVYTGFTLGNADDEVILECNGIEIDRVEYDDGATFPDPDGASMILAHPGLDNNDGSNWCESSSVYGDGDLGTPGALNDSCQEIIGSMAGCKYNDANNNSQIDEEEGKLGGWTIILERQEGEDWQEMATTTTQLAGEDLGCYLFNDLVAGNYRVSESLDGQTGWLQTYPTSTPYWEISLEPGQALSEINFANYLSCTDNDGDGYALEGGDCGLVDCDDTNENIYPGALEICDNGLDDDCDGTIDCDDSNCSDDPVCAEEPGPTPAAPRPAAAGGGGGGPTGLIIFNERTQEIQTDRATLTWFTNLSATSRVVYDTESHTNLATPLAIPPNYSYTSSSLEDSNKVTFHTVIVTGLASCTNYYWRAISHRSPEILGDEITFTTKCLFEEVPEEGIIEEEVTAEVPLEEEVIEEIEEIEEEIPLVTEAEAEEVAEEEKPKEEKPEEKERPEEEKAEEEAPSGLLAAMANLFRPDNFCWFFFLIILALVVLWLLLEMRKKKEKKQMGLLIPEKEREWIRWILPLIIAVLVILHCYFCCSNCWLLLLIIAILIALFFWYKKRKEKEGKV